MSSTAADTRLDCLVREAVANYGSYTATVAGLGDGRADRVLELNVDCEDLTHAYTRAPFNKANKVPAGCRIRHFVYVIPIEQRHGQEQRMLVGSDGEDLDMAMFFRPSAAASDAVYVTMPELAFSGPGSEVQYAFRVRNYFERPNGVLEPRDDIQIGMELTTSTQAKHPRRGVVLVTNNQLFSFQLGAMGDKHAGFKMQYNPLRLVASESTCELSVAELHTQVFGSIVEPLAPEDIMAKAIHWHYYTYTSRRAYGGGATRGGVMRGGGLTKGGSSFSHASLVAGEEKRWNLSVSNAVPISKRARAKLSLMVGDILQVFTPDREHSSVPPALPVVLFAPTATPVDTSNGYDKSMRCLEMIRAQGVRNVEDDKLALLWADMCPWPVDNGSEALAVGVREHEDKDDEDGQDLSATVKSLSKRVYTVQEGTFLRVRVTNMTLDDTCIINVHPFYCKATSECGTCCFWEEAENRVSLKAGESYEMPFPLQKEPGEGTDGWVFKDGDGKTVLTVLFVLPAAPEPARNEEDHVAFHALKPAREQDKMDIDTEAGAQGATGSEKLEPECCVCLEPKTVGQMAAFIPCGHCVCCIQCYTKQVKADTASGKRSKCPKCRVFVRDTMRLFF
jgi:hypothetical protein